MANSAKPSEQIEVRIRAAHAKGRLSIKCFDAIVEACGFLDKNKIGITIAQVGALTGVKPRAIGGIKTQSIRNNADFSGYIRARAADQNLVAVNDTVNKKTAFRTGDATTDGYIQTIEGENQQLKGQLANLRAAIPRLGEYDLKTALEQGKLVLLEPRESSVPIAVFDAIKSLLDHRLLHLVGLEIMETGQIAAPEMANAILLSKPQVETLKAFVERQQNRVASQSTI